MRVLVLSQIFPNAEEPLSSPFNRQQLTALSALCDVEIIAPVPWFPGARLLGRRLRAGRLTTVIPHERLQGLEVRHPRALYVPVIGSAIAVPLYTLSVQRIVESYRGRCDVLLASWLYPDACSALSLAATLDIPCVVKAHGSDVQRIGKRWDVQPMVRAWLPKASAVVAPSRSLVRALIDLGAPRRHAHHIPNGVDRSIFRPRDRAASRARLGLGRDDRLVVFVGRLTREKGVADLIRAGERVDNTRFALIGEGPLRSRFDASSSSSERWLTPGALPLPEVAEWMAAADVVTLPSWSEGTPNVVLEALASGRPVVATRVGGIPDVVEEGRAGHLVPPRSPEALADALRTALNTTWDPEAISNLGPKSWNESAAMLERVLRSAVRQYREVSHVVA